MAYPVPEVWTVSGALSKNGIPFWTIKVSGQIPSDAKIVMFIKYIAQSAV